MIKIEKAEKTVLDKMGVYSWPTWEKEVSRFDWKYDDRETFYVLDGKARIEPDEGEPVEFGVGDLVTISKGLSCVWDITAPIKKHYKFG